MDPQGEESNGIQYTEIVLLCNSSICAALILCMFCSMFSPPFPPFFNWSVILCKLADVCRLFTVVSFFFFFGKEKKREGTKEFSPWGDMEELLRLYESSCTQNKTKPNKLVVEGLSCAPLVVLHLEKTLLGNGGVASLSACLPSLPSLRVLGLAANYMAILVSRHSVGQWRIHSVESKRLACKQTLT